MAAPKGSQLVIPARKTPRTRILPGTQLHRRAEGRRGHEAGQRDAVGREHKGREHGAEGPGRTRHACAALRSPKQLTQARRTLRMRIRRMRRGCRRIGAPCASAAICLLPTNRNRAWQTTTTLRVPSVNLLDSLRASSSILRGPTANLLDSLHASSSTLRGPSANLLGPLWSSSGPTAAFSSSGSPVAAGGPKGDDRYRTRNSCRQRARAHRLWRSSAEAGQPAASTTLMVGG